MQQAPKLGRPRRYDIEGLPDFANADVAYAAALLDELRERVMDQIADLPQEAVAFVPEGTTLSIAALVVHQVWAEAGWISRITGVVVPEDLAQRLEPGNKVPKGEPVSPDVSADELVTLCRRVRDELTRPALAGVQDIDGVIQNDASPLTPRGVLMHLIWHWTYHSGQVGLLRELWGSGYTWTFGPLGKVAD